MSTKIYTKTGDDGLTSLFGGERVPKNSLRIEAYGTVDELNSVLGLARSISAVPRISEMLERLQIDLFVMGADLATPIEQKVKYSIPRIEEEDSVRLENWIDELEMTLPPLKRFIIPGGSQLAAHLHQARTVTRRTERAVISLREESLTRKEDIVFLNRLSDLLFVLARYANKELGVEDIEWDGQRPSH